MQPEYSEQWRSPAQQQQPQQQQQWHQRSQQQAAQQEQQPVPPQWQQQPWPQQQWQQPAAPQWQQQQVQHPWPQQPWQQPLPGQAWPQQHRGAGVGRPGALRLLFGVSLAIGFLEAIWGLLTPLITPTAIGFMFGGRWTAIMFGDRWTAVVFGVVLIGFAVFSLLRPNVGRIGLVAVSGLALVDSLIGVPLVGTGNLSPLVAVPMVLWLVVPVIAFLPPANRACRR